MTSPATHDLDAAYLAFARRVLSDLTTWIGSNDVPRRTEERVVFQDNGFAVDREERVFFWPILKDHYGDELFATTEATEAACLHLSRGILQSPQLSDASGKPIVAPTFEQMRSFVVLDLLRPLVGAIERHGTISVTDDQIIDSYRAARAMWTAKQFEHALMVPVYQLEGTIDQLELRPGLTFSPFLPSEKSSAWAMSTIPFWGPDVWEFQGSKYKLLHVETLKRGKQPDEAAVRKDVYNFISALRLLQPGPVGTLGIFSGLAGSSAQCYTWPTPELEVRRFGTVYTLTNDLAMSALALFRRITQGFDAGSLRALEVALRRFNLSYGRTFPEDKIIDLTVALESTLLYGIEAEIQYRLSLRGAALLRQAEDPSIVRTDLNAVYEVRSAIVHAGSSVDEALNRKSLRALAATMSATDFVARTEALVRSIIREYIARLGPGTAIADVNRQLDAIVLQGLKSSPSEHAR